MEILSLFPFITQATKANTLVQCIIRTPSVTQARGVPPAWIVLVSMDTVMMVLMVRAFAVSANLSSLALSVTTVVLASKACATMEFWEMVNVSTVIHNTMESTVIPRACALCVTRDLTEPEIARATPLSTGESTVNTRAHVTEETVMKKQESVKLVHLAIMDQRVNPVFVCMVLVSTV